MPNAYSYNTIRSTQSIITRIERKTIFVLIFYLCIMKLIICIYMTKIVCRQRYYQMQINSILNKRKLNKADVFCSATDKSMSQ